MVKRYVITLMIALAACSSTRHRSLPPTITSTTPTTNRTSAPHAPPALSARVVLPSTTMAAGASMAGNVTVRNNTGHVVTTVGCQQLFQVALENATVHPQVGWLDCLQRFTIAPGTSTYPVTVAASYLACTSGPPQGALPQCLPNGRSPALPAGTYRAVLHQRTHLVPVPPPITIEVTRAP